MLDLTCVIEDDNSSSSSGSQEVEVVSCDVGRRVKAGKGGIFVIYLVKE
jgi:hypothetical protein